MRTEPKPPPRALNHEGAPRRIGVEVEFAALSAMEGARLVQRLWGGEIVEEDPHRFHVEGARWGRFTCELDTQYAHRPKGGEGRDADPEEGSLDAMLARFRDGLRRVVGDVSALVMPCEIVCPPVPITELGELEALIDALRGAGASGTRASPLYGFGAQLNPEIAEGGDAWIRDVLRANLLMSDWLRGVMQLDVTRRVIAFADPFPKDYVALATDPDRAADREGMIADYLRWNPTRNRELDMLPLFKWLAPDVVSAAVPDPRVGARPTFHWRLPDANFDQPGWSLAVEWNRWRVLERLAEDRELLDRLGAAWAENRRRTLPQNWALTSSEMVMTSWA